MRDVVCFGCGEIGSYFAKTYGNCVNIKYFLDNRSVEEKKFLEYDRFTPSKEKCKNNFVVVTNTKYYQEISYQLNSYGLVENKDFMSIEKFLKHYSEVRARLKTIKCWFVDFWEGFNIYDNIFIQSLKKYYNVILDEKEPDFLFCSVFYHGECKALLYQCPRIFYTGENLIPDFNIYDYAIGFEYMTYKDRYLRWPYYRLCWDFELAKRKHINYCIEDFMERKFCCRVVSNPNCEYRENLFDELNKQKYVASGGKCKNNMPDGACVVNKHTFLMKYKFNLAIENSNTSGYITEKIVQAWGAGCIPVYWGSAGTVKNEFNEAAFIDCSDFASISDVVQYLLELEKNQDLLKKMLSAPIFLDEPENDDVLENFLRKIIEKPEDQRIKRLSALNSSCAKRQEQMYKSFKCW